MIDKSLMVHSCTVYTPEGSTADRKPIYDEGLTLTHVRISHTNGFVVGSNGLQTSDTMTLWFDCSVSYPSNFIPVEKQKVVFNNKEYFIESVKPSYALSDSVEFYKAVLK